VRRVQNRKRIIRSETTHTNGNERQKHDEDRNENIEERKPLYQIQNDKPKHLRRLCNETQITKILLHKSGRISWTNGHRWKKNGENSRLYKTPSYTDDGKSIGLVSL
jgi:hypothetical protein